MLTDGWLDSYEQGASPRMQSRKRVYEGVPRDDVLADIERRKIEIRLSAQRGLVRDQVEELFKDIFSLDSLADLHDANVKELYEIQTEGKKGEAGKYLQLARTNSTRIDVDHEIWKMESFLQNVVAMNEGEQMGDWRSRAYPVLGTTNEEIAETTLNGRINQAKTLLSIIRFLSAKGIESLDESEKMHLAASLKGLEISLSRAGRNLNSIGARKEELKPVRDAVGKSDIHSRYLYNFAWILKHYPEITESVK